MAKWTRVGDIPKKIPVNFVVDSDKYPELAAWIYSFPHGEMGKTVREILSDYAKAAVPTPSVPVSQTAPSPAVPTPIRPASPPRVAQPEAEQDESSDSVSSGMDATTAGYLKQLDMDS